MSGRASVTQLALPTGIKKLTNIAVVRLKKAGVRFEIACYKNTVVAWRDGFEKDLDNVLQTTKVYNNVSKGVFAKEEDLLKAFGTKDEEKVSLLILTDGELQVSEKERKNVFDTIFRDAVTVLVEKCVNPSTNRPYPPGMIERALREIHFSVDPMRSAKQQALAAIPKLRAVFPIKRAAMRFKFVVGNEWFDKTIQWIESGAVLDAVVERTTKNTNDSESEIVCVADPSAYRLCDAFARDETGKTGRLEVVTVAVTEGGVSSGAFESSSGVSGGVLVAKSDKGDETNEALGPFSDAIREVARDVRVLDLDAAGGRRRRRRAARVARVFPDRVRRRAPLRARGGRRGRRWCRSAVRAGSDQRLA
jgi:ribosome maturation protein SDO1